MTSELTSKVKYFTDTNSIENNAIIALAEFEKHENISKLAVFPDIHYCSEKNLPVGVAFETTDCFYPLITGKDLGCGVMYLKIDKKDYLKPFDKNQHYRAFDRESYRMTDEGLGGGNHFLSLEESDNYLYVICHTGSRNLGIYMYNKMWKMLADYSNNETQYLPMESATAEFAEEYLKMLRYASSRRMEFVTKTFDFLVKNKYVKHDANYDIKDSVHNHLTFENGRVIHRKGSTELVHDDEAVIPLSMTRGSLIVKANVWSPDTELALKSCSHGAGRRLSRTDTLKFWKSSLKESQRKEYRESFSELLDRSGNFSNGYVQEFDFAYKNSNDLLSSQPYLIKVDETKPIATVKFTEI